MQIHALKTWSEQFQAIWDEVKHFEIRKDDRDFHTGDILILQEWNPKTETYTGRSARRTVAYILPGGQFGVEPGYCIMSITTNTPIHE